MKVVVLLAVVFSLNSCNTMIGMWRDGEQAYHWTREKVQSSGGSQVIEDDYGAPVY